MGIIKPQFTQADLQKAFAQKAQQLERQIIRNLQYLGEKCVTMSRKAMNIDPSAFPINYGDDEVKKPLQQREGAPPVKFGDYRDQTGNLRNSIGYVVVANGQIVTKSSDVNGHGEAQLTSLAARYKTGYALIIVAGMDYAVHVESKGYNVISSSEKYAAAYMPTLLAKLKLK